MAAGIAYGDGATKRMVSAVAYGDGATKRVLKAIYYGDGATVRQVYSAYTPITISANNVYSSVPPAKGTYTLGNSTVTVTGGNGAFTYTCARISGTAFAAVSGTGASRTFKYTNVQAAPIEPGTETWRWTVTDGVTTDTQDFTVSYD